MDRHQSGIAFTQKYRIGEACRILGITPATLRHWEKVFPLLSPKKTRGGQREYSEEDLRFLGRVIELTRVEGRSLKGSRAILEGVNLPESPQWVGETLVDLRKAIQLMDETDSEIGA
ncbi:MAG: MerR family transcriptional regulator [Leptospirillum sp.]